MPTQNIHIETPKSIGLSLQKASYTKIGLLVDENTERDCYPLIKKWLPVHSLVRTTSGGNHKTIFSCVDIWSQLTQKEFDRHSLILILGGGTLGDMGGFCSSTFKRGIDFMFIPTTVLAQADACIGGKLGVNFDHYKNHLGVFREPKSVFISSSFLKTLPPRELRSGFAEIVKHFLIGNRVAWDSLRQHQWDAPPWDHLITQSMQFKSQIVANDPYEKGQRKILNFGHTIGHAIESCWLEQEKEMLHGEAIALGMIAESHIALGKKKIHQNEFSQITSYLISVFGKLPLPPIESIVHRINQDKKKKKGQILMSLIKSIGHAEWDIEVSLKEVRDSLIYYQAIEEKPPCL